MKSTVLKILSAAVAVTVFSACENQQGSLDKILFGASEQLTFLTSGGNTEEPPAEENIEIVPVSENINAALPVTVNTEPIAIPENEYQGVFLKIDENSKGFIAELSSGDLASCSNVSCLMDAVLGAISSDDYAGYQESFSPAAVSVLNPQNATEGSGFSLISRRVIEAAAVPTEISTVQIIVNKTAELKEAIPSARAGGDDGFNADEIRNHYVNLLGHVSGSSGTITGLPSNGDANLLRRKFRLEIQATKENGADKPALIMIVVTPLDHFPNVEETVVNLVNGTNVAPVSYSQVAHTDSFTFAGQSKVDFVFAVDNSGSMSQEITGVVKHAMAFFNRLAKLGVDYQIAVIASDRPTIAGPQTNGTINYDRNGDGTVSTADNCSASVYRKGFSNTIADFRDSVCVGTSGSGRESNILEATRSLRHDPLNSSVTDNSTTVKEGRRLNGRSSVNLSFIMVTDEGDQFYKYEGNVAMPRNSTYFGSHTPFDTQTNDFVNKITNQVYYKVYGVIGLNNEGVPGTCSGHDGLNTVAADNANNSYITGAAWNYMVADGEPVYKGIYDLAKDTKGAVSSICSANYGAFLEQVADQEAARASSMKLSHVPITSSLKVYVNGIEIPAGFAEAGEPTRYFYNSVENAIGFTGIQPVVSDAVTVSYKYFTQN